MENCVGKIEEYDDQINRIKPLNQRQGIWKLIHNQVIYRQPIQERQSIKSFSAAFGTMPAYSTLVGAVWLCGNWSGWTTSAFLMTDTRGFAVHYTHQAQTKGIYLREWWIVQGLYTFGRFYRNYQFKLSSSSSSSFPDFFLFFFFIHSESIWRVFFYQRTVSLLFTLSCCYCSGLIRKTWAATVRTFPAKARDFLHWMTDAGHVFCTDQATKKTRGKKEKKEGRRERTYLISFPSFSPFVLENDDHITEENQQMDKSITKISIPIGHT